MDGLTCPHCAAQGQTPGSFCTGCGRVVVQLPAWAEAQHRRRPVFTRRRVITAAISIVVLGLIVWINFPFLPDPVILFFHRPTTQLSSAASQQWGMEGGTLGLTRFVEAAPRQPSGTVVWTQDLGPPTRSSPVAVDGTVYIGGSFKVLALDAATGRILWEQPTSGPVHSSLAVAGDFLYAGLLDHRLVALERQTGGLRWEYRTGDTISASPVVHKGIVYIGSWDGFVYALDAATGKAIWRYQATGAVRSPVSISQGVLFVTDMEGNLHSLNARTGQDRLMYRTAGPATGAPVAANGLAYFPSAGRIFAVDAKTREIPGQFQFKRVWAQLWLWQVPGVPRPPGQQGGRWRFTPQDPSAGIAASPAVAGETLYTGDMAGNFYARDALNGGEAWQFQADGAVAASPLVVGSRVYFGTSAGSLYALDKTTGEVIWQRDMGAPVEVAPIYANGRLLVRTVDGLLHSLK